MTENELKWYAVTLQPATRLLIKSAATTALGFPTSDFLQTVIHNFDIVTRNPTRENTTHSSAWHFTSTTH